MERKDAEDADAADVADGVPGQGWAHGQTACEPAGGQLTQKFPSDWTFQAPNTLLKQEGLQLAEARFRDFGGEKPGTRWNTLIQPRPLTLAARTLGVDTLFGALRQKQEKQKDL